MHFQNHASDNTGGVGESKEKIDLNQDKTMQHLTHSHGKNNQPNLARRAAKQAKEAP
uniref:Uncharacterized protein n=1 Tax=Anopheles funestus TaxID=62324 RepID=A0A182R4H2_ANOFN